MTHLLNEVVNSALGYGLYMLTKRSLRLIKQKIMKRPTVTMRVKS